MKYLSFIIPCYNSSEYMSKCIDSVVHLGEDVEVLIIDDGSNKDNTFEIAKEYEKNFPKICKAIHKKNGGHGDALNVGLKNAKGLYFKVVDSDDWLNKKEVKKLLDKIKECVKKNYNVDMFITNYIYDKVGKKHKKEISYKLIIPRNKVIGWENTKIFTPGHYLLMHSITYRTKVLKECKLVLPKHTFYVDNIFAFLPLVYCKKIYYMDIPLYHYFIGRSDQSVNEKIMLSRLEQQYKITRIMLYDIDFSKIKNRKLKNYLLSYLNMIMTVTCVFSILSKEEKWLNEKDNLWEELKKKKPNLYRELLFTFLGMGVNLPGRTGRQLVKIGYKLANKFYGFN